MTPSIVKIIQHQWQMDGWVQSTEEITATNKTKVFADKTVPVPLCPLQMPHELAWDRTLASQVRDLQLTA
jgi:hypothetical protein